MTNVMLAQKDQWALKECIQTYVIEKAHKNLNTEIIDKTFLMTLYRTPFTLNNRSLLNELNSEYEKI